MTPPAVQSGNARATERRYRSSVRNALMAHLGKTPEEATWCVAALEVLWEYGGVSPFRIAANARHKGNQELYRRALADDARLTALAKAAKASE